MGTMFFSGRDFPTGKEKNGKRDFMGGEKSREEGRGGGGGNLKIQIIK